MTITNEDLSHLLKQVNLMRKVVEAARKIRWEEVGTIDYMEGSEIYRDLSRVKDALNRFEEEVKT